MIKTGLFYKDIPICNPTFIDGLLWILTPKRTIKIDDSILEYKKRGGKIYITEFKIKSKNATS